MRLSIVICTRIRVPLLGPMLDALRAVRSAHEYEILFVDNASTDNTLAVLGAALATLPHARVISCDRIGLGAARDIAWRAARGQLILFTDDDCYVQPDIVDAAVAVFERHPEIGYAGGRILLFDPADYPVTIDERTEPANIAPFEFKRAGALQGANITFRRSSLERIGGVDPMLGAGTAFPCEDIDAVAACAWQGIKGRFDPTIVLSHHHRRKEADMPKQKMTYDKGRGAYYAKFILNPVSRTAYLRGWFALCLSAVDGGSIGKFRREMASARAYWTLRGERVVLALSFPAAALVLLAQYGLLAGRRLFGRIPAPNAQG